MLHDPQHIALGVLDNPAVTKGVLQESRQHRDGRAGGTMAVHQFADRRGPEQRHVAAEDQDGPAVAFKELRGLPDGVSRPELLPLVDEGQPPVTVASLHEIRLVANDDGDPG